MKTTWAGGFDTGLFFQFKWPWIIAYAFLHGAEHPCTTYFDVHQEGFAGFDHSQVNCLDFPGPRGASRRV